jgi:hypothetical protein
LLVARCLFEAQLPSYRHRFAYSLATQYRELLLGYKICRLFPNKKESIVIQVQGCHSHRNVYLQLHFSTRHNSPKNFQTLPISILSLNLSKLRPNTMNWHHQFQKSSSNSSTIFSFHAERKERKAVKKETRIPWFGIFKRSKKNNHIGM